MSRNKPPSIGDTQKTSLTPMPPGPGVSMIGEDPLSFSKADPMFRLILAELELPHRATGKRRKIMASKNRMAIDKPRDTPQETNNTGHDIKYRLNHPNGADLEELDDTFLESLTKDLSDIEAPASCTHKDIQGLVFKYTPWGSFVSKEPLCTYLVPQASDMTEVPHERGGYACQLSKTDSNIPRGSGPAQLQKPKHKRRWIPLNIAQENPSFKKTFLRNIAEQNRMFLVGQIVQCNKDILGKKPKPRPALVYDISFDPENGEPIYHLMGITTCEGAGLGNTWMSPALKKLCLKFRNDGEIADDSEVLEFEGNNPLKTTSFLNTDEIWHVKGSELKAYKESQFYLTPDSLGMVIEYHKRALETGTKDKYPYDWQPSGSTNGNPGSPMMPWLPLPSLTNNRHPPSPQQLGGGVLVLVLYMKEQQKLKVWVQTPVVSSSAPSKKDTARNLNTKS